MMKLYNATSKASRQWIDVCVEGDHGDDALFRGKMVSTGSNNEDPVEFPAVGGPRQGAGRLYFVRAMLPSQQGATGDLDFSPDHAAPPFRFSNWVSDDYPALMTRLCVRLAGETEARKTPIPMLDLDNTKDDFIRIVEQNPARVEVNVRSRLPAVGITFENWLRIYSDQDVVEQDTFIHFGMVGVEGVSVSIDEMWLESGEYLHLDYLTRKGLQPPVRVGDVWVQRIFDRPRSIGRAQTVDLPGALLCMPPWERIAPTLATGDPQVLDRFSALQARKEAPLFGGFQWEKWMAFQRVAEIPGGDPEAGVAEATRRLQQFADSLQHAGDLAERRPYALSTNPGSTGAQEDFGSSKGVLASAVGDGAIPWMMRYSVESCAMRPESNREDNGNPVVATDHPHCKQWSHIPDPRQGTTDLLGWPVDRPWGWQNPRLGDWSAMDDQHYSINNLCAMLQLTGSKALSQVVDGLLELDFMSVPGRLGAPRGVGRRLLAWSHVLAVGNTQQKAKAAALIRELMTNDFPLCDMIAGGHLTNPSSEIRVLNAQGGKYGWLDPSGDMVVAWIPWEESIACQGMHAASLQLDDETYDQYVYAVAKTITKYAFYQELGQWYCCYGVRSVRDGNGVHTGAALPPSAYTNTQPNYDVFTYGMWSWTLPAVLMYRELAKRHFPSDPEIARADQIIRDVIGTSPRSWDQAEWLACAPI